MKISGQTDVVRKWEPQEKCLFFDRKIREGKVIAPRNDGSLELVVKSHGVKFNVHPHELVPLERKEEFESWVKIY